MIRKVSRNGCELYIRPLRLADTDRLVAFIVGLSEDSRRLFRPHAFNREDARRAAREAETGRSTRLVITRAGIEEVTGYGYFSDSGTLDSRLPLLGIAIADSFQNQGLGRLLMEALIEEARDQGRAGLQLTVYKENARAIHLYTALGFRIVGDADGGQQYAMRLDFAPNNAVFSQRGIFLNPVPWDLAQLTLDTWPAADWIAYLNFLHSAGANLVKIFVWPSQYYHPDEPDTIRESWRFGVLRQALTHARGLGMRTCVGFLFNGVPPSVWQRHPELRAEEIGTLGLTLCWTRAHAEIARFPALLIDALADCTDDFILWVTGPAYCACPHCRDYQRVVRHAVERYSALLSSRGALHLSMAAARELEDRAGATAAEDLVPLLPENRFVLVEAYERRISPRLRERELPIVVYDARLDAGDDAEGEAIMPRPRLRQVNRLIAQNSDVSGIMGRRILPRTQFVTDFVLLQKLLLPAQADHEILRDLGGRLYSGSSDAFGFARSIWALDTWWETGRRSDLTDAANGLEALPPDALGWVRHLRDTVQILTVLHRYLEDGERHFDSLVARIHGRMAESPLFQCYTVDRIWHARARRNVSALVSGWLDLLREHLIRTAP